MRIRTLVALVALVSGAAASALRQQLPRADSESARVPAGRRQGRCQYSKTALKTIEKCLQAIQSGKLSGDPATVCLGTSPSDPSTAAKMHQGCRRRPARRYRRRATTPMPPRSRTPTSAPARPALPLPPASPTASSPTCWHTSERCGAAYGTVVAVDRQGRPEVPGIPRQGVGQVRQGQLKAVQQCLDDAQRDRLRLGESGGALPRAAGRRAAARRPLSSRRRQRRDQAAHQDRQGLHRYPGRRPRCLRQRRRRRERLPGVRAQQRRRAARRDQNRSVRAASPASTATAAANAADTEDTILLEPGSYVEEVTLKDSGLTVRRREGLCDGARAVFTPPEPALALRHPALRLAAAELPRHLGQRRCCRASR